MSFFQKTCLLLICILQPLYELDAQVANAKRSGFTWINTENVTDQNYGSGYTLYSAAWPIFDAYPGSSGFQMGLAGCWLSTQRTGNEPTEFYTTIEGGLGWWHDTQFGTRIPKFIMGGVSYNFFSWANGPGAGKTNLLANGQRDWSTPGGKYGVAQLSNRLLWAPDGLNMAQGLNGEMLGYGYNPLPLTEPMTETNGQDIETGNQCWTLFLNSTNFKGPATFFLPTYWTEPVLSDPSLEGLFLDSRPSNPNVGFGIEHATSPALISESSDGNTYAKIKRLQFPATKGDISMLLNQISVYSPSALWDDMLSWFSGGPSVSPEALQTGSLPVNITNNGGSMVGRISGSGIEHDIDLDYIDNIQLSQRSMGYEYDLDAVEKKDGRFILPEYFKLEADNKWHDLKKDQVPASTNLINAAVPTTPRKEITYLTPLEPDCHWQDPNGPWNDPGPVAGPFQVDMGDGSTLTYYWYRFIDQPAIIHANLPQSIRNEMQRRVELIHTNWNHTDEYLAPPTMGNLATLDSKGIVSPPQGLEIGYVPIVTRQEKTNKKLRVFVLAGQSNMEGFGSVTDPENDPGTLIDVISNDVDGNWSVIGTPGNWTSLDGVSLYFANDGDTIRTNVTVGQGDNSNLIGAELMFAHQLDAYYDDPILIIKTAWGGKNLAVDFRPPSAGGTTGEFYNKMIQTVQGVTQNLGNEFPNIATTDYEISGFAWFQGWNDGASSSFLQEYESNLNHLVNDVRNDLNIPHLPIVIASSGHGGYAATGDGWVQNMQNIVSVAQESVGCNDAVFGGKVGFVDTKRYYFDSSVSPHNAIHHFNNNALTFLNIGKSIGDEMILAINDMAFCNDACPELTTPDLVSVGNRVWNDCNLNGVNDPDEPGIPGVSLVIWADSDGDNIPDWQGFGGIEVTDDEGYYRFSGLLPGNYIVFVWSVDNWGPGQPLEGFQSTNAFVLNADNNIDFDNNGSGGPFTDIKSGIVTLSIGEEPLNDGDPDHDYFDYDPNGNNTVDFGFFNPNEDTDNDGLTNVEEITGVDNLSTLAIQPTGQTSDPKNVCDPLMLDPSCLLGIPSAEDDNFSISYNGTTIIDPLTNDDFGPNGPSMGSIAFISSTAGISVVVDHGTTTNDPTDDRLVITTDGSSPEGTAQVIYEICDSDGDCDQAIISLSLDAGCIDVDVAVLLEGAFDPSIGRMRTDLNTLGYLPGQVPTTFFGVPTPVGQPYNATIWMYNGDEGQVLSNDASLNGGYTTDVTDWILLSLRTDVSKASTICTKAGLLLSDGSIHFVNGFNCCDSDISGSYYLVVEHRNHLIIMSDFQVPVINGTLSYDFRNQQSYKGLLGYGQKNIGGKWLMFAGNSEQSLTGSSDTDINVKDKDDWLIGNGSNSSYYFNDFDLNGDVNVQDKNLWLDNNGKFTDVPRN